MSFIEKNSRVSLFCMSLGLTAILDMADHALPFEMPTHTCDTTLCWFFFLLCCKCWKAPGTSLFHAYFLPKEPHTFSDTCQLYRSMTHRSLFTDLTFALNLTYFSTVYLTALLRYLKRILNITVLKLKHWFFYFSNFIAPQFSKA